MTVTVIFWSWIIVAAVVAYFIGWKIRGRSSSARIDALERQAKNAQSDAREHESKAKKLETKLAGAENSCESLRNQIIERDAAFDTAQKTHEKDIKGSKQRQTDLALSLSAANEENEKLVACKKELVRQRNEAQADLVMANNTIKDRTAQNAREHKAWSQWTSLKPFIKAVMKRDKTFKAKFDKIVASYNAEVKQHNDKNTPPVKRWRNRTTDVFPITPLK
ncbi:hypothetical protein [uncultured Paraglaciecola sp.]|uniref:hypothetical protein n=1 Tax=uncultured Paraglaciecola sp. TaxID=1765024 RepID=UPI00261BC44C|nr:hypothetical protein [uncultured Paraglaciecola sp.]